MRRETEEEKRRAAEEAEKSGKAACGQGLTLVPISTQLEPTLPLSAQLKLTLCTICVPKVIKLSSNVSYVSRRSSS